MQKKKKKIIEKQEKATEKQRKHLSDFKFQNVEKGIREEERKDFKINLLNVPSIAKNKDERSDRRRWNLRRVSCLIYL